jgi:N-acetylmuramate 1-kinase
MMDHLAGEEEISAWVKKFRTIESVVRLPGDASTRRYFRIHTHVSNSRSLIAMKMEPFPKEKSGLPFLAIQKHLTECGVDVPQVLDVDPEKGFILLEDLGDVTLLRRLQGVSNPEDERHLYERALDGLLGLQIQAGPKSKSAKKLDAFKLSFDHEKLMWEVRFTIEQFYQLYLKRTLRSRDLKVLTDGMSEICTILAEQPRVLAHRDFHSRNIMVTPKEDSSGERLVMIDFQDARMGLLQYDLASLLKDSYYQLEESQIQILLDYYLASYEARSGQKIDREEFRRIFDFASVQRNFKAIGSFASFMNKRSDPTYLKYIGNTFENIRRVLLKYPEYSDLREVLFHYYYF